MLHEFKIFKKYPRLGHSLALSRLLFGQVVPATLPHSNHKITQRLIALAFTSVFKQSLFR